MISREEAIAQFQTIIGQKTSWLKLLSSQFMEHLAIFVSWCLREALWRLERLNQEFFVSTALNRASIMAHVEDREYLPRKRTPSNGIVRITNNGTATVALPVYTVFEADNQLQYVTTTAVTIAAGAYADVNVEQRVQTSTVFNIEAEKNFYEVLFTKDESTQLCDFSVYLDVDGLGFDEWTYSRLFVNSYADSTVYDEFFSHTEQVGIRFGNGVFGMVPPLNAKVKIVYWTTDGETTLLTGQEMQPVGDILDYAKGVADLTAIVQENIDGGGESESTEEIRRNLHYWPVYNDKLVWADDYIFYIKKQLDNILWINVWGEEEQEAISGFDVQNINRIFISAYANNNTGLSTDILAKLAEVKILNRKFTWVAPLFSTFDITISGKVGRTIVIAEAVEAIAKALTTYYSKDSASRKDKVFTKDFYDIINDLDYFTDTKAYFNISTTGVLEATALNEMVSIDTITINLTYV